MPTRSRRILLWSMLAFIVACVAAFFILGAWFHSFLRSDSFRKLIGAKTSAMLKAEGQFLPLHFAGSMVYSDGFHASGNAEAFFSVLQADQIRAELNPRALYHRTLRIDELSIERLELQGKTPQAAPVSEPATHESLPPLAPARVDLRRVSVRETNFNWSGAAGSVKKTALTITPDGSGWEILGEGGDVTQQGLPDLKIDKIKLRYQSPSLFVTDSVLRCGESGSVTLDGEANFGRSVDLRMKLNSIPVTPFLKGDWRARLKGNFSGEIKMAAQMPMIMPSRFEGSLAMAEGQIEALPVLNQIALFTRTAQFRSLRLSKASANFTHDGSQLCVKDFVVESEGLIRAEGAFVVTGGQIQGTFQVGVTPASLQWIPGSQSRVFTDARGGYLWTTMRVSGAVEHPSEDLTPRLLSAAGSELLENPEGVLKKAADGLLDIVKPLLK
jgi:hypothetical protein